MRRDSEAVTGILVRELARLRRRAVRQKRSIKSKPEAWRDWSATIDEIAAVTQRLVVPRSDDLDDLAAKFDAILWLIEFNESLLDSDDLRRLRRFGRDLSILASRHA
jgi:hypothetical protein